MVMDRRPDEAFFDVVQRGVETFKSVAQGIATVIRTGDEVLQEMDGALTGGRPRFGETPREMFSNVLAMLTGTLEDARERGSPAAPSVVQKAREVLNRVNAAEPSWRPGPTVTNTAADMFRVAIRDLRSSVSMLRLAQGHGTVDDIESLSKWADDVNDRLTQVKNAVTESRGRTSAKKAAPVAQEAQEAQEEAPPAPTPKRTPPSTSKRKKDTTPKAKPAPDDVRYALAVAEEYGDKKVKGWAQDFVGGKISEQQWINRLTTHASAERDSLDDVFARAEQRIARENDAKSGPAEGQS